MSRRGVQFVKQDQPAFLRKFKERVGMKAEATVSDKIQTGTEDCVEGEHDDEKPVVVVLKDGDLTAEEAETQDKKETDDGKVVFKKPTKRTKECGLSATTKKSKLDSIGERNSEKIRDEDVTSSESRNKKKNKPVSSLLSFDESDDG